MKIFSRRHLPANRDPRTFDGPLLDEYVIDLSIASLEEADVTALYERLVLDPRLGAPERHELTEAFLLLRAGTTTESLELPLLP